MHVQLWTRDHAGATPLHVAASRPMMEILLAAAQLQIAASTGGCCCALNCCHGWKVHLV